MKKLPIILFFVVMAVVVNASDDISEINKVLDTLHTTAKHAHGDTYFSLFTDDAIYIGTDASETWTIDEFKTFAQPYFSKGQGWTYTPTQRNVQLAKSESVAWFVELLHNEKYGTSRGTGVLVKDNNRWKIAQYHLTFPMPNELSKKITNEIKQFERNKK